VAIKACKTSGTYLLINWYSWRDSTTAFDFELTSRRFRSSGGRDFDICLEVSRPGIFQESLAVSGSGQATLYLMR
jgi:hypothetical protein